MAGCTRQQAFDAIQKQIAQTAAIQNSTATLPKPKRKRRKPAGPAKRFTAAAEPPPPQPPAEPDERSRLELLAREIEESDFSVEELAKRSQVDPIQIEQFLQGDSDALDDDEQERIAAAIETASAISAMATNIRAGQPPARPAPATPRVRSKQQRQNKLALEINRHTTLTCESLSKRTRGAVDAETINQFLIYHNAGKRFELTDAELEALEMIVGIENDIALKARRVQDGRARSRARGN